MSREPVSKAAVEAAAKARYEREAPETAGPWEKAPANSRLIEALREDVREDLEAALPIHDAELKERLLGEEAIKRAATAWGDYHYGRGWRLIDPAPEAVIAERERLAKVHALAVVTAALEEPSSFSLPQEDCETVPDWQVGDVAEHRTGSRWKLTEHLDGKEHDDWVAELTYAPIHLGTPPGTCRVFHREYMDRSFTRVGTGKHQPTEEKQDAPARVCPECGGTNPRCPICKKFGFEAPTEKTDAPSEEALKSEIIRLLDSEFRRQAGGAKPRDDYQTGFDAGIREVKKLIAHPNVRLPAPSEEKPVLSSEDRKRIREIASVIPADEFPESVHFLRQLADQESEGEDRG